MSDQIDKCPVIPETPDEAFLNEKAGFSLDGEELAAYSPVRKVAAQAMGLIYPLIPEEDEERFDKSGQYAGVAKDMAIVLWLCSIPTVAKEKGAWTPSRVLRNRTDAMMAAIDFAAEKGFDDISSPNYMQAYATFLQIVSGESITQFVLKESLNSGPSEASSDPKI